MKIEVTFVGEGPDADALEVNLWGRRVRAPRVAAAPAATAGVAAEGVAA